MLSITYLIYIPHGGGSVSYNDEIYYTITARNDITMVVCDSEHTEVLLSKRCGCASCGIEKPCFRRASMEEILEWSKV